MFYDTDRKELVIPTILEINFSIFNKIMLCCDID